MQQRSPQHVSIVGAAAAALPLACAPAIPSAFAQDAPPTPEPPVEQRPAAEVRVSEHMTVDLRVHDEDLANVLQMLSLQSHRNIVASRAVSARVTANLYGVTFYEALDSILHVNGYGYVERGNFIYVYTLEELTQIRQAERRPIAKVITLNYLNGADAAQFVAPLLSEIGEIRTNGDVGPFSINDVPVGREDFALAATLVVYDYPDHVEEVERLVRQLDTRPSQVLVEATILQTKLTEANAFGLDFSVIGNLDFADFVPSGGPLSIFNALRSPGGGDDQGNVGAQEGSTIISTPGNTGAPGGTLRIGIVEGDFSLFIRMLDEVADTTVLSNPKILALNRQPARVLVGRRIGYLSTTATETSSTQTVQFLDTGTQLAFRPFISNDGLIRMELRPSVSQGFIRTTTNSVGVPISIPDEETQELTTNVIVRDGSTIVLGGLFKETTNLARRQVPILGDIPIIGTPFRGHDDNIDRVEIIFLITPTIVNDTTLLAQGEAATSFSERVRAGVRQGLLPWSRDRMTAKLNVEADEAMRRGEHDQALWKVRRSLELNPTQPDAIHLREELTRERDLWPTRSILEEIYRGTLTPGAPRPEREPPAPESSNLGAPNAARGPVVEPCYDDDEIAFVDSSRLGFHPVFEEWPQIRTIATTPIADVSTPAPTTIAPAVASAPLPLIPPADDPYPNDGPMRRAWADFKRALGATNEIVSVQENDE